MQTMEEIFVKRRILENSRKPDLTFHRNGRIDITARISDMLELHEGDVIDLLFSGEDWYLYVKYRHDKVVGRHEAQCYPTNRGKRRCRNFRASSKRICDTVLAMSGGETARVIAGNSREYSNIGKAVVIIPKCNILNKE